MDAEVENKKSLQKARIEDWYIDQDDCIVGKVFDHPKIDDGYSVRTSRVVTWSPMTMTAVTKNTEYILGKRSRQPWEKK